MGLLSTYTTETFGITDRLGVQVNVGNGNLVVAANDVSLAGPGLSLTVNRFYNSRATGAGAFGARSVMSTGRDIGLAITASTITFYGPSGFAKLFTSNGAGGWSMPAGINADLVKNADGTYTLTYQRTGERLTFSSGGFLTADTDRNGNTIKPLYNTDGSLASLTDTAGRVTSFAYSGDRVSSVTDPAGRVTTYTYDPSTGELTSAAGSGTTVTYTYTAGKLARLKTGENRFTDFGYDTSGRVTTVTRYLTADSTTGGSAVTTFAYPSSTKTTETNANGKTTTYNLDANGRATSVIDPLGRMRSTTYTPNGDVATAVDAMGVGTTAGNTTTYTYDTANNPTSTAAPTGAIARAYYAASSGNCVTNDTGHKFQAKCLTGTDGAKSTLTYDGPGNVTSASRTTSGGAVTKTLTYQGAGSVSCGGRAGQVCSSTDGNGRKTTFGYDTDGNLTTVTPPTVTTGTQLGKTTIDYDSIGRATSVTDGKGQVTSYFYDQADRNTYITYDPSSDAIASTYDKDGNLTLVQDNRAASKRYIYDGASRQTATGLPTSGVPISVTLDGVGNTLTYTDPSGTVTYTYDAANQLTSLAEPGGTCPATGAGTKCTRFGYNANGARTSVTYPGGTTQTTTVDNSGRPTRILATSPAGTLSDLAYSYTAATAGTASNTDRSVIQSRTETVSITGLAAGTTQRYTYDTLGRLTGAKEYPTASSTTSATGWAYGYDNQGNRTTSAVTAGGSTTNTTWGYNEVDQLISRNGSTTGWAYDANGNQTSSPGSAAENVLARTTAFNVRDQITSLTTSGVSGTTTAFGYFATSNNDRTNAGATTFTNALLGTSATTTSGATTAYTRAPDGALISQRSSSGSSRYYLTDILGSTIGLVDPAGAKTASYSYDPYGQARITTGTDAPSNPYRYTRGYLDITTGLYKLGYRYYDPSEGRFTQEDPTDQEANAYAYALGDPINNVDTAGTKTTSIAFNHDQTVRVIGLLNEYGLLIGLIGTVVGLVTADAPLAVTAAVAGTLLLIGANELNTELNLGRCPVIDVETLFGVPVGGSYRFSEC